jgi:hypothetical protein
MIMRHLLRKQILFYESPVASGGNFYYSNTLNLKNLSLDSIFCVENKSDRGKRVAIRLHGSGFLAAPQNV